MGDFERYLKKVERYVNSRFTMLEHYSVGENKAGVFWILDSRKLSIVTHWAPLPSLPNE